MCIMFTKQEDENFPTMDCMKICWDDNRDGAGYAWYDPEQNDWVVTKGLMSWDAFKEEFEWDRKQYDLDNKTVVVHFRVGTTGGITGGATHPFPAMLTKDVTVHTLRYRAKAIMFHNGTVGFGTAQYSDTQRAAMEFCYPMVPHIFENNEVDEKLMDLLATMLKADSCRYVLCYENNIRVLGKWVTDPVSGLDFSNERFKLEDTRFWKQEEAAITQAKRKAELAAKWGSLGKSFTGNVVELPAAVRKAAKFMKDGIWNWVAWDGRYNIKQETDTTTTTADDLLPVYGADDEILYYISKNGETATIATPKTEGLITAETLFCKTCTLIMHITDLNDGECPGCGTIMLPDEPEGKDERDYECPVCQAKFGIEPTCQFEGREGVDDECQCCKCGCIWGYTKNGSDWVLGHVTSNGEFIPSEAINKVKEK